MDNSLTVEFTSDELYLLLGLFGPCIAFGVTNPNLGKFIEEIESAQLQAQQSLVDRGLVRFDDDGEVSVDEVVAHMAETCARPTHTAIATFQKAGQAKQILYLHFSQGLLVEQVPLDSGHHQLAPLPNRTSALTHLKRMLQLDGQQAAPSSKFQVSEEELFKARDACADGNRELARQVLSVAGLNFDQAKLLTDAFTNPVANSSVVIVINRNEDDTRHVKGLGVFESTLGLWALLLTPLQSGTQVEFIPSSAEEIESRLNSLLP